MGQAADRPVTDLRDPVAFRAFYAEMLPRVYSFAYHRCGGNQAVAEDVVQETFMAAVREIRGGAAVREPTAWLFGLARHKLFDQFRAEAREERRLSLVWQAPKEDPEWQPSEELARERTLAALAVLPASQRHALTLRYLDEMSVPEIATALGRSVHATESLLARGRDAFRRAYEEVRDGE